MSSFAISPNTFVATSATYAVATGDATSWTSGLVFSAPGLTIAVLSVDVPSQTARLSVVAGNSPGPAVVTDGVLYSALEVTPFDGLITLDYAAAAFASGDRVLTAAQAAALPDKVLEASAHVRRWCGDRDFTRRTYDQTYSPAPDGTISLRQVPVNRVLRVSGGRAAGLTIRNDDRQTNSRAVVGFTSIGDEATGLTFTGLALSRVAAGLAIEVDLPFALHPTLGQLAGAIVALGNGWSATVAANLAGWPSGDLVGGDVAQNALASGAELEVFAEDLDGCRLDRRTGELSVGLGGGSRRSDGPRWGPYRDPDASSDLPDRVRVVYDAGFDIIPWPVQEVTALAAIALMDKLQVDGSLAEADLGNTRVYRFSPELISALPRSAVDRLAFYRIVRV